MRRKNQPLMTAAESLIGIEYDDPLKTAKRNARRIVANYDFRPLKERYEVVEECHAGRTYRFYAEVLGRINNDRAVVSVLTDGHGAFWGYAVEETGLWGKAMTTEAYWLATKAFVEAWSQRKAQQATRRVSA